MLSQQRWLDFCEALPIELLQSADEGKNVSLLSPRIEELLKLPKSSPARNALGAGILAEIEALPADTPYVEPSDLDGIRAECAGSLMSNASLQEDRLFDQIYGAWLARCAGCLLGQPVEGWNRDRLVGLLKETGNYPVQFYISSAIDPDLRERYRVSDEGQVYGSNRVNWINNVSYMPEDDDTNYTIIALKLMEKYGFDFTPEDVAECWLANLPILHVCTAERVAYLNLVNLLPPPQSASYRNAYREYIGAQIRGDLFGYVTPGNPALAAELAWRDASISHVKNGIYGEMLIAAMIAQAAVCDNLEAVIRTGLAQIPRKSRLYEAIETVLDWYRDGMDWETALEEIHKRYDETSDYHWCHTISNAMIVCIGLLFGEKDFECTMGICLCAGFDTDCNCATAGSVIGILLGSAALPEKWIAPLCDRVKSGVDGFGLEAISDLARRTVSLISIQ